ncbi:AbrB family transcriptional regulator [Nisaea acidiphila]|uniref:AbrB family transcriptional regulator n=1 Tax=Nisaea acidiphila TaxID=1862145 RepID=A0A9J7B0B5_9PROT|nr:AbrB family transcriptional regulator [Nisaea acidiphila]UUX51924.1 AbrB family transcriptional regulator [Nisaea acidiphila]
MPAATLARHALSLAIAAAGGWLFALLHVPLPWLLGPMLAIAAISMSGYTLSMPKGARQVGQLLLGTGIGLNFTPEVAAFVAQHIVVMVICALTSIGFGLISALYLRKVAKVDIATAFFSSLPGGVVEMALQATRWGGEMAPVSLAQSLRILCVVTTIPTTLILIGATGHSPFEAAKLPFEPAGFPFLIAASILVGGLMAWRRITNAWILGPLIAAAFITVLKLDLSGMPRELLNLSQVLIGCFIGLRYRRELVLSLRGFLPHAVVSTIVLVGLNVAFGIGIAGITGLPASTMVLSVSPGGMAEMSITAAVLELGVPLIAAFHIVRIFLVIGLSGLIFRYVLSPWT